MDNMKLGIVGDSLVGVQGSASGSHMLLVVVLIMGRDQYLLRGNS